MHASPPSARFWTYSPQGSRVRITLRPGKTLVAHHGIATDEGWYTDHCEWHHAGDHVLMVLAHGCQDCDGLLTSYRELTCPLGQLTAIQGAPAWNVVTHDQYDAQAEAAGY